MILSRLFKRKTVKKWEKELLLNVLEKLPNDYLPLINQINEGLFRRVLLNTNKDIPGFVSFGLNHDVYEKFKNDKQRSYKLSNIKIKNSNSSEPLFLDIYISSAVIIGYAIIGENNVKLINYSIDVSEYKKLFFEEIDFDRISNLLNVEEIKLLSPSEIYSVNIDGKEYFHLKDLEDGDFIGLDIEKNIYKITHDPKNIIKLSDKLDKILSSI